VSLEIAEIVKEIFKFEEITRKFDEVDKKNWINQKERDLLRLKTNLFKNRELHSDFNQKQSQIAETFAFISDLNNHRTSNIRLDPEFKSLAG
jgi:hypothetical protein